MMCASFNDNPCTTIVSCYSSTNSSKEMGIVTFFDELSSLVQHIPKHNALIIGGDMNAQIVKDKNKLCLYNLPYRNKEYLADFSLKNRLAYLNTILKKRRENYKPTLTQITL